MLTVSAPEFEFPMRTIPVESRNAISAASRLRLPAVSVPRLIGRVFKFCRTTRFAVPELTDAPMLRLFAISVIVPAVAVMPPPPIARMPSVAVVASVICIVPPAASFVAVAVIVAVPPACPVYAIFPVAPAPVFVKVTLWTGLRPGESVIPSLAVTFRLCAVVEEIAPVPVTPPSTASRVIEPTLWREFEISMAAAAVERVRNASGSGRVVAKAASTEIAPVMPVTTVESPTVTPASAFSVFNSAPLRFSAAPEPPRLTARAAAYGRSMIVEVPASTVPPARFMSSARRRMGSSEAVIAPDVWTRLAPAPCAVTTASPVPPAVMAVTVRFPVAFVTETSPSEVDAFVIVTASVSLMARFPAAVSVASMVAAVVVSVVPAPASPEEK